MVTCFTRSLYMAGNHVHANQSKECDVTELVYFNQAWLCIKYNKIFLAGFPNNLNNAVMPRNKSKGKKADSNPFCYKESQERIVRVNCQTHVRIYQQLPINVPTSTRRNSGLICSARISTTTTQIYHVPYPDAQKSF